MQTVSEKKFYLGLYIPIMTVDKEGPENCVSPIPANAIRENPDHATFREKEHTLGWLDKLGVSLSLSLCNLANFDDLYLRRYRQYQLT